MTTKRMTAIEALVCFETGYQQAELQLIWETGSSQPIIEIMALSDCSKGQAARLWNARPKNESQWQDLEREIQRIRKLKGLPPKAPWQS